MEKEIIEGNKLIAEFMKFPSNKHLENWVDVPNEYISIYGKHFGIGFNCKFHKSWDWLMPVVEKIESIKIPQVAYGFEFSIKGKRCITLSKITGEDVVVIGFHNYDKKYFYTKLEATWLAVVEFIKWYNKCQK